MRYTTPMVTVHHLNNSRSQRVLWLLEELGVPYDVKRYQRDAKTMLAPPALLAIHPLGKSPVITDDEGFTVAESGAIVEYLVDKYGGRPPDTAGGHARADALYVLAALRGRVRHAAFVAQVDLRPNRNRPDALARERRGTPYFRQRAGRLHRAPADAAP
jgi:glutathione S-transferase